MKETHVLIIDDNPMGGEILAQILQSMDISCTILQTSVDITRIQAYVPDFDAVFLDLEMPTIDGYEALQILKQELGLQVPVVAYSVHTSEIAMAREMGFDGFLGKPLDLDTAADYIQRILNGGEVWAVS